MKKVISLILIIGFLFVDFLFFHDIFKAGEVTTVPQYITGVLSIIVIAFAFRALIEPSRPTARS